MNTSTPPTGAEAVYTLILWFAYSVSMGLLGFILGRRRESIVSKIRSVGSRVVEYWTVDPKRSEVLTKLLSLTWIAIGLYGLSNGALGMGSFAVVGLIIFLCRKKIARWFISSSQSCVNHSACSGCLRLGILSISTLLMVIALTSFVFWIMTMMIVIEGAGFLMR